jgi:thioredoxin reductase
VRHDAIVVGGSFAGLSAALYIARARRSICILDTGSPRNRFAEHSHGSFGQDGSAPRAMLAAARSQVASYPTTTFINEKAIRAKREAGGFSVELATGQVLEAARLVLAFGVSDELPDIPGLAERWGVSVLHCPYCHAYEFGGRRLGVLNVSPNSIQQALLIADWGPTTLYLNGAPGPDDASRTQLQGRGVAVEPARVTALHGSATQLSSIELADGRRSDADALFLRPWTRLNSDISEQLGCETEEGPNGRFIRTDSERMTTVPDVYAAGDIARASHFVTWACADGVTAGLAVHRSLIPQLRESGAIACKP